MASTFEVTVGDWRMLCDELLGLATDRAWACRGEPGLFADVLPAIDRETRVRWRDDVAGRLIVERIILQRFSEQSHGFVPPHEREFLDHPFASAMLARHYGAPTRLLDWTHSPWVAAFFACERCLEEDGRIRLFDHFLLTRCVRERFGAQTAQLDKVHPGSDLLNLFHKDWVAGVHDWIVCSHLQLSQFQRLIVQQGLFTVASKPYLDHWETVLRTLGRDADHLRVITIKASAKPQILQGLERMGITAASLFPGADGIGMSLRAFAGFSHLDLGVARSLQRELAGDRPTEPPRPPAGA